MSDLLILCHSPCNVPDEAEVIAQSENCLEELCCFNDFFFVVVVAVVFLKHLDSFIVEKNTSQVNVYFAFGIVFVETREGNDKHKEMTGNKET